MTERSNPTGPTQATIKRLFARSGNQCAFPRCPTSLVQGTTVLGEMCHIKAANPRGQRYDPQQTAAERHDYANIIMMCPTHHTIIDDDPEAYTVDRLVKLKADHEGRSAALPEEEADRGALLIIDQTVRSANQFGGITAHTVNQIYHLQETPIDSERQDQRRADKLQLQAEARRHLAPELNRTIERVLYIHSRAIPNFVCASAESKIKPNDLKSDFIPHWPALYPNAPQCRDLASEDAAALIAFYDSLHSLADFVNDWWEREGQLPVNIFNMILHSADKSLKLALVCIRKFELEKLCPPQYESWGTLSARLERSIASAEEARTYHIARFEAKAKAAPKTPLPLQRPRRA